MKKSIYLIPIVGIMFSCTGEKKDAQKSPEVMQTDSIEVVQGVGDSINPADTEIEQTQSEVDSLLKNI